MAELIILGPILSFVFLALVIAVVFVFGRGLAWLIANGIIGVIALTLVNLFPIVNIPINIWSVLIVALGGIPGFLILILLDVLKIAF